MTIPGHGHEDVADGEKDDGGDGGLHGLGFRGAQQKGRTAEQFARGFRVCGVPISRLFRRSGGRALRFQ
jgi:hypothetical protein